METQTMDNQKMYMNSQDNNISKYSGQLKYLRSEKGKQKHNESKRRYYASHPEYRERHSLRVKEYRRCEKELKTEFIRLSGILC